MIVCVCLRGIMENSVNCHVKVMEFYDQISVNPGRKMNIIPGFYSQTFQVFFNMFSYHNSRNGFVVSVLF